MDRTLIELETQNNLLRAKMELLAEAPEKFFINEHDIESYMKTFKIDSYEDLQHMVNFYIKRAFRKANGLQD